MSKCHLCKSPFGDEDRRTGKCSNCGEPLPASERSNQEESGQDDAARRGTVEFTEPPRDFGDTDELILPSTNDGGSPAEQRKTVDFSPGPIGASDTTELPIGGVTPDASPPDDLRSDTVTWENRPDEAKDVDPNRGTVDYTNASHFGQDEEAPDQPKDGTQDTAEIPAEGVKAIDTDKAPTETPKPPQGKPDTVPELPHLNTVEFKEITSEDKAKITQVWGNTVAEPERHPERVTMTIKGETPTVTTKSTLVVAPRSLRKSTERESQNADYEILDKLGEGGMGTVFLARQAAINRIVALKMLKSDTHSDVEQRQKFLSEAVVTGDLDHPNIVPIYDLGSNEDGSLFYSMKRVQGTPWLDVINEKTQHENLEILMSVADAVAFAHDRGVVHRDLKPENVMLGEYGEVLLLDWGLAIPTAGFGKTESITQTSAMGGTPAYMAPEMAAGPLDEVGPSADIYLLGAILYEIITGAPPHVGEDVMKCLVAAAKNRIQPTTKKGELVDIAHRAMAMLPEDRFATVKDFQDALRNYLSHTESIALTTRANKQLEEARESDDYQDYSRSLFAFQEAHALWEGNAEAKSGEAKTTLAYAQSAQRKGDYDLALSLLDSHNIQHAPLINEVQAAQIERDQRQQRLRRLRRITQVGVALFVVVVTGASIWIWHERNIALEAQAEANAQKEEAEKQEGIANVARDEALEAQGIAEVERKKAEVARDDEQRARGVAEYEREKAVAAKDEATRQRNKAEYQAYIALIGLAAAKIEENAFGVARLLLDECPSTLRHWEWGRLRYLCNQSVQNYDASVPLEALGFSQAGTFITGGWNGKALIWQQESGDVLHELPHGESDFVYAAALSPDGAIAATGSNDQGGGFLRLWDANTGEPLKTLEGHTDAVVSVAFSGDGKRLLSSSFDHTARWWDVSSGKLLRTFHGHRSWVWSAAFCYRWDETGQPLPEQRIVTASQDGFAIVWDLDAAEGEAGAASPPFRGHRGPIYSAAFSPDGRSVATGGYDKRVLVWSPEELTDFEFENVIFNTEREAEGSDEDRPVSPPKYRAFDGHTAAVRSVAFDRAGQRLLSGGHDNTVRAWNVQSGQLIKTLRGHDSWVRSCCFSPDQAWVFSASHDHQAKRWSIESYEEVRRVPRGRVLEGHESDILMASFSKDGRYVITASRDRTARKWGVEQGDEQVRFTEGHSYLASRAEFFPGGRLMITAAVDNTARIWDVTSGTELTRLEATGRHAAVAVSPDGRWVLTGSSENAARLWSVLGEEDDQGQMVCRVKVEQNLPGHKALVTAVAFSNDGAKMATCDGNGRVILWSLRDGVAEALGDLEGHTGRITAVAFLPNGERLLTASGDGTVAQWQVDTREERQDLLLRHTRGGTVTSLAITPDGRRAVTSCDDGQLRLWDVERAEVLRTLKARRPIRNAAGEVVGLVTAVDISPDGRLAASLNVAAHALRLWDLQTGEEVERADANAEPAAYLDFGDRGLIWSLTFAPDNAQLATVGGDNARLWDIRLDQPPKEESQIFIPQGAVASADISPDGQRVVTSSWDSSARIWNANTGRAERKLEGGHAGAVNSAVFSPDGSQVLTASDDRTAKIWDANTGQVLQVFRGHDGAIHRAVFSADGSLVLTASSDATARIWIAATGEQRSVFRGHRFAVLSAAFSRDGLHVVTGGEDNTAIVWDAATQKPLLELEGHTAAVTSVAFAPDGKRVLTGSDDYSVKLWDAEPPLGEDSDLQDDSAPKGKEILTLKGHEQEVKSVCFSEDGVYALTGSRDGTAIIWLAESLPEADARLSQNVARP